MQSEPSQSLKKLSLSEQNLATPVQSNQHGRSLHDESKPPLSSNEKSSGRDWSDIHHESDLQGFQRRSEAQNVNNTKIESTDLCPKNDNNLQEGESHSQLIYSEGSKSITLTSEKPGRVSIATHLSKIEKLPSGKDIYRLETLNLTIF